MEVLGPASPSDRDGTVSCHSLIAPLRRHHLNDLAQDHHRDFDGGIEQGTAITWMELPLPRIKETRWGDREDIFIVTDEDEPRR